MISEIKKKFQNIFKKFSNDIKIVVHCAGQPSHDWAYKNPSLDFETKCKRHIKSFTKF